MFHYPERPESIDNCTKDKVRVNILRPPHKHLTHINSSNSHALYGKYENAWLDPDLNFASDDQGKVIQSSILFVDDHCLKGFVLGKSYCERRKEGEVTNQGNNAYLISL